MKCSQISWLSSLFLSSPIIFSLCLTSGPLCSPILPTHNSVVSVANVCYLFSFKHWVLCFSFEILFTLSSYYTVNSRHVFLGARCHRSKQLTWVKTIELPISLWMHSDIKGVGGITFYTIAPVNEHFTSLFGLSLRKCYMKSFMLTCSWFNCLWALLSWELQEQVNC